MTYMLRLFIGVSLFITLSAAALPVSGAQTPEFVPGDCPFTVPQGEDIECGIVTVTENRTTNTGTVRLPVAILYSRSATPAPDPVIYLEGGPGGSAMVAPEVWYDSPFRQNRDIILFDQRGTGFSEPSLNCPEMEDGELDALDAAQACYDRLVSEGVDVAAYTSAENAADVDAIRQALGYDQVNLYGISYGTRLALTVVRDYPAGVRSIVIDGVYPPNVNGYDEQPVHAARAFRVLFDNCAADAACGAAFPDLENRFYAKVDELNNAPEIVEFEGEEVELYGDDIINAIFGQLYATSVIPALPAAIDALANGDYETYLDLITYGPPTDDAGGIAEGDFTSEDAMEEAYLIFDELTDDEYFQLEDLILANDVQGIVNFLTNLFDLSDPQAIAEAMIMIYNEDTGSDEGFEEGEEGGDFPEGIDDSEGMFNSVECNEEVLFNNLDVVYELAAFANMPPALENAMVIGVEDQFATCDLWDSGAAAAFENDPVVSDIPALVLSGEYDPITPPEWGARAAETLPNSYQYVFPGVGHGSIDGGDCPLGIAGAFLDNPTQAPDSSCIAGMRVQYYIP